MISNSDPTLQSTVRLSTERERWAGRLSELHNVDQVMYFESTREISAIFSCEDVKAIFIWGHSCIYLEQSSQVYLYSPKSQILSERALQQHNMTPSIVRPSIQIRRNSKSTKIPFNWGKKPQEEQYSRVPPPRQTGMQQDSCIQWRQEATEGYHSHRRSKVKRCGWEPDQRPVCLFFFLLTSKQD